MDQVYILGDTNCDQSLNDSDDPTKALINLCSIYWEKHKKQTNKQTENSAS